jgi:CubicO group peptidase (beta-lactamase class C family)
VAEFDPVRLAGAAAVLRDGLAAGAAPGGVVCALRGGEIILQEALGTLDGERPVCLDTRYDLASLTKPMATGAVLVRLVEQGVLSLQSAIADLAPEFAAFERVTVGQLLTHTSGLPAWTALYESGSTLRDAVVTIAALPRAAPGAVYAYSCLGFILLQRVIETVIGEPLGEVARDLVFEPLGLRDTGYRPDAALAGNIAPTRSGEGPGHDDPLVGVVHDGNARSLGGISGNAGLFGTASDVARFGEGVRDGAFFGAPTRARALASEIAPSLGAHTLLFFGGGNPLCPTGDLLSRRAVGHSGFTGTVLVIDPEYDLTVAVLTNAVYGAGKTHWLGLRRRFLNALASSLR